MDLQEWKESGLQLIKALRLRGEEKAFRRLLSNLYPDEAHFIYELLQNAEDAKAEYCLFKLNQTALEFEHNGSRLFSENDVRAITSFGNSTKRDDPTSIGEFGVGFKAVFAYTNTPEIHSGEFHFRIHDLVVPDTDGVKRTSGDDTRFVFPFNHPTKRPVSAVSETERALRALGDNTLLFLNHIRKIEYRLPDKTLGILERIDHDGGHIEIRARHPGGQDKVSHWLRFQKDVEVIDEDGKAKTCRIAIAYSLVEEEFRKRHSRWKIVPLNHGQVSIYFPADSVDSRLRFHLHAPFASTVARDSVRKCEANNQLRDRIAELMVESLTAIRDEGMLTVGFLAVLPNPNDGLSEFFEPIREEVVRAFIDNPLTPTKSGTHARATSLYRGPARISEVIDDDDLSLLTNFDPPLWAANPRQQNQREDHFLDSLEIENWGWSELTSALSALDDDDREPIEDWISQKDDAWVMRFYALLGEACDVHHESLDAQGIRIVRVGSGQGHEHVLPQEAFLLPEQGTTPHLNILFVKPTVYSTGRSEAQKKFAVSFLEHIGVRPFDAKRVIELSLERYRIPGDYLKLTEQVGDEHYRDLKQFIDYWKKTPGDAEIFRKYRFLLGVDNEGNLKWYTPLRLCLDHPYEETSLAGLSNIHRKHVVWGGYKEKLSASLTNDFIAFMKSIGVMHKLRVVRVSTHYNPRAEELIQDYLRGARETKSRSDDDYTITFIEEYISAKSVLASRLLWNALIGAAPKVATARFRTNQKYDIRTAESQLVSALRKHAWIPGKTGDFFKPEEITQADLRTDFPYDDRNGLLTAIGFGEQAKKQSVKYQAKNDAAKEIGFHSAEEAEEIAKLVHEMGITPEKLRSLASQHQRVSQPEESVQNPERRHKGLLERRDNAPTKESVTRERTIQPGAKLEILEAKAYLRARYTNPEGHLVCQCCQSKMPFKVREFDYFEAVQCVRGLDHHFRENRLALCPTCAAMYQHARETDDAEIRRSIIKHDALDTVAFIEIPISLAGRQFLLHFVGTHWFDLKTILTGTAN